MNRSRWLACVVSGTLIPTGTLWAQTSPVQIPAANIEIVTHFERPSLINKAEVTGSAITARQSKEALPVLVIGHQEIERSGATNLAQLVQRLPTMFNFLELGGMTGTAEGGPESAAIHGSTSGTLVLLNGRRLPTYGSPAILLDRSMVDMNVLPLSAIDRIELLTDGASSRYGSDAMSGVVNIITKNYTRGFTVATEYTARSAASGQGAHLSWGSGRLQNNGYRLQAHFSIEKQDALMARDVPHASSGAYPVQVDGQNLWAYNLNGVTQHGWPGNIHDGTSVVHPLVQQTQQCPSDWITSPSPTGTQCWRNNQAKHTLYPATDKKMLFIDGELALGDTWRAYGHILLGQHEQRSIPLDGIAVSLPMDNGLKAMVDTSVIGALQQSYQTRHHQYLVGLTGDWSGWDVRANVATAKHRVERYYTGGLYPSRAIFQSVGITAAEAAQTAQAFTPELLAKFAPMAQVLDRALDLGFMGLDNLDVLTSNEIGSHEHGPISLGLGLSWRRESIAYTSPLSPVNRPAFSSSRQNWASFAELQTPISPTQQITLAVRHDQYSDFGGVQTGKLGWRWRPNSELMFRSSVGTGFRAPSLGEMIPLSTLVDGLTDPVTQVTLYGRNLGNPELKPETSVQASAGLRWEPSQRWSLGADLWHLHIKNTFGHYDFNEVYYNATLRAQYLVTENSQSYLNLPNINLGQSVRQGIDYDLQWRQPMAFGRVRVALRGAWNLVAKKQSSALSDSESELGRYAANTASYTPKHQWTLSGTLEKSQGHGTVALNYRSGFMHTMWLASYIGGDTNTPVETRIPGYWTLDLSGQWRPSKNWTLTGHVQNLTQRYPVRMLVTSSIFSGVDTRFASYYGRTVKLKAEYKF